MAIHDYQASQSTYLDVDVHLCQCTARLQYSVTMRISEIGAGEA
jgi:hypothetical protein